MKILILILMLITSTAEAAMIDKSAQIAVMDLGLHKGTSDTEVDLINAEIVSSEYIINRLASYDFNVIDKDLIKNKLQAENLNLTGIIDPDTAKRIGEILGVKYIVYGNILSVTVETEEGMYKEVFTESKTTTFIARIVLRIMNVENGKIIMASKGGGSSQITKGRTLFFIKFGNFAVSEECVHNALKKAAYNAVDVLVKRLQ